MSRDYRHGQRTEFRKDRRSVPESASRREMGITEQRKENFLRHALLHQDFDALEDYDEHLPLIEVRGVSETDDERS